VHKAEQLRYIRLIRQSAVSPLEPLPVQLSPEWEALTPGAGQPFPQKIKAILFDIYGTLFISGAGEIAAAADAPPEAASKTAGASSKGGSAEEPELAEMRDYFRRMVNQYHEKARAAGQAFPEVVAEEIWAHYDGNLPRNWEIPRKMQHVRRKTKHSIILRGPSRELALHYELAVNPVYPMPHAEETLRALAAGGTKLGIISNAQFYTPLLFHAFFNGSPEALGFDPALLIYSFKEREAKPSPRLFEKARAQLAREKIKPEETLYIGNDMRNDIGPAAGVGFKTVLFAGDRRSLRLREETFREEKGKEKSKPDLVIKDLQDLIQSR